MACLTQRIISESLARWSLYGLKKYIQYYKYIFFLVKIYSEISNIFKRI